MLILSMKLSLNISITSTHSYTVKARKARPMIFVRDNIINNDYFNPQYFLIFTVKTLTTIPSKPIKMPIGSIP